MKDYFGREFKVGQRVAFPCVMDRSVRVEERFIVKVNENTLSVTRKPTSWEIDRKKKPTISTIRITENLIIHPDDVGIEQDHFERTDKDYRFC